MNDDKDVTARKRDPRYQTVTTQAEVRARMKSDDDEYTSKGKKKKTNSIFKFFSKKSSTNEKSPRGDIEVKPKGYSKNCPNRLESSSERSSEYPYDEIGGIKTRHNHVKKQEAEKQIMNATNVDARLKTKTKIPQMFQRPAMKQTQSPSLTQNASMTARDNVEAEENVVNRRTEIFKREIISRDSLQLKSLRATGGHLVADRIRIFQPENQNSPGSLAKRDVTQQQVKPVHRQNEEYSERGVSNNDQSTEERHRHLVTGEDGLKEEEHDCVKSTAAPNLSTIDTRQDDPYMIVTGDTSGIEKTANYNFAARDVQPVMTRKRDTKGGMFVQNTIDELRKLARSPSSGTLAKNAVTKIQRKDFPGHKKDIPQDNMTILNNKGTVDNNLVSATHEMYSNRNEDAFQAEKHTEEEVMGPVVIDTHGATQTQSTRVAKHNEDKDTGKTDNAVTEDQKYLTKYNNELREDYEDLESKKLRKKHKVNLPDQRELDDLCRELGRKSKHVRSVCRRISRYIKRKDAKIIHVWPCYQSGVEDKITFVVVVTDKDMKLEKMLEYSFKKRVLNDFGEESNEIIYSRKSFHLAQEDAKRIRSSITRNAAELMKNHAYLSIISESPVRSKCYGTPEFNITQEACIVLYVHTKGYIPLDEEPFEKVYDEVPVDVREGEFDLYGTFPAMSNKGKSCRLTGIVGKEVRKIGPVTDDTKGILTSESSLTAVRKENCTITMYKQLEVKSVDGESVLFADKGDSGSLMFINGNDNELVCVGIVEGGTSYNTTIFTPITPSLQQFNVTNNKSFDNLIERIDRIDDELSAIKNNLEKFHGEFQTFLKNMGKNNDTGTEYFV